MTQRQKYHRSYHFPWSGTVHSDDKLNKDINCLEGKEVVVTVKMDGECTTMYNDDFHARSLDSKHNFTRDWVARLHSVIKHDIPEGYRFVGENLWAEHSIKYPDDYLEGYFYLFSIWKDNFCLSFDDVLEYAELLDLPTPKILYRGIYNEDIIKEICNNLDTDLEEGIVTRTAEGYLLKDASKHLAKYVRPGHVQENAEHWLKNAKQNGKHKEPCKPIFMSSNNTFKI